MKRKQNIIKLLSMGLITLFSINGFAQCNASNLSQNIGNYVVGHVRVGQTFTAPCTGFIVKVKIDFNIIPITTGDRILRIKDGNTPSSPVIHTQTIPFNSIVIGTNTIVLTTPIPINSGEINGFEITEVVPNSNSASGVAHNSPGNYLNGDAWFSGVNTLSGYDLTFQVEISNCGTLSPTGVATQTFCNSATVDDLSATGSSIQWYATAIGGSPLPGGTALTNGTTYYASQTVAGCESVNRLAVNTVINSTNTPTGTSTQTFCNSATINDLSSTGSSIQWYATATGGSPLPGGTALTNGTTYYASQTVAGCESVNRLAVNAVINSTNTPTGTSTQTFCNSATINDLSATGSSIQWYATAIGGSPLPGGTALTNGTTYYASQTVSGCESANRFAVNVVINSTATPTGISTQTFCNSATINDLSAIGSSIQWYASAIGGSPLAASTALINGSTYYASQTVSGCESANRLAVNAVINSTNTPTGTSTQTFCNSATINDLSATGSSIQWYATAIGGFPLSGGTALTNGTTYYASQTVAGCESVNRLAVNAVINSTNTPTGTSTQTFCNSATINDLSATGSSIQWYASASGGSPLAGTTSLVNGSTYYASQTVSGCESANRFAVNVVINSTATPTGSATQTFCNSAQISDLTATGTAIQWYASASGGSPLAGTTSLVNGSTYYASQTVSGCESANRFAVNVVINSTATPTGTATQTFCNSAQISDLTATGTAIQWYAAASGGSPLAGTISLVNGSTYYASQTVSGCESANRFAVNVVISTVSDITTSVSGISITANNTNASYVWLDCNNNFSIIPSATAQTFTATTNGSYAVQLTENGCVDTSSCVTITTVGLESIHDNYVLSIFPNPTDGVFSLNLGRTENEIITMISDVHGRIISYNLFNNKQVLTLDIEGPSGFYFVTVIAGNKQNVIKLNKN